MNGLLTEALRQSLPSLYATESVDNPTVHAKFFTPWTSWTWYATEFDGVDVFFGLVVGHEVELGYFSLKELESIRGPGGLRIERDLSFKPTPLNTIRAGIDGQHGPPFSSSHLHEGRGR